MFETFLDWVRNPDFMPHGHCYLWSPSLLWTYIISNATIAISYFSIPLALIYFVRKRKDIPFNWIWLCFCAFILACGTTHLTAIWTIWYPDYWLDAGIEILTAAISIVTAVLLWPLIPKALKIPSAQSLGDVIAKLQHEIDERAKVEAALRRSEERYRLLLQSTLDFAVITLDIDGSIMSWNDGAEKIVGYGEDEAIGNHLSLLYDMEDRAKEIPTRDLAAALANGRLESEHWRLRKDGCAFWANSVITPLYAEDSILYGYSVIVRDITEHKNRETKLLEYTALQYAILDCAGYAIIATKPNGAITLFNPAAERMLGYNATEVINVYPPPDILDAEETKARARMLSLELGTEVKPGFEAVIAKARQGGFDANEWTYIRKDGSRFQVLLTVTALRNNQGQIFGFLGIAADLTDRKKAEERFRTAVETAPSAILIVDPNGKISTANDEAIRIFGYQRNEMLGLAIESLLPDAPRRDHAEYRQKFQQQPQARRMGMGRNLYALRKNGELFPVEIGLSAIETSQGISAIAMVLDITERLQQQRQLEQAKADAESAARAKAEFLANMSHEIRTPMNGILGMTALALKTALTQRQREYLTMVEDSAESLLRLINDILDFSKMEAGKLELVTNHFDLREKLGGTLHRLAMTTSQKGIELLFRVAEEVPYVLHGDFERLIQVVINLVGNATKFTDHGEIVVNVDVRERHDKMVTLHFSVRDTGIGIPPAALQRIFDAFSQVDNSTTRRHGGTGLGLTISKQIIDLMSGDIWVESTERIGSIFHFTVRFGLPETEKAIRTRYAWLEEKSVLVVDDNSTNLRILQELLEAWRMHPTLVNSGAAALKAIAQSIDGNSPFAIIIVDERMPEIDGFDLSERIHQRWGLTEIPILMLSSGDLSNALTQWLATQITHAHLRKPVRQQDLFNVLKNLLAGSLAESTATKATDSILPLLGKPLHVLLAEDHIINQKLALAILTERGHTVRVAENGKQAVQLFQQETFDLVLMDLQMPEMDGITAAAEIRALEAGTNRHVRIIALTAHALTKGIEYTLQGLDGYLPKPFFPAQLLAMAEGWNTSDASSMEPSSVPHHAPACFDLKKALAHAMNNMDFLKELCAVFIKNAPQMRDELHSAAAEQNMTALARGAHKLKGAISNFSASSCISATEKLEKAALSRQTGKIPKLLRDLDDEIENLLAALRKL